MPPGARWRTIALVMTTPVIVSYDGTTNDDDALALGRMLAIGGAALSLAYVRHSREYDPRREEIGVYDADRRLEQGPSGSGSRTSSATW